MGDGRLWRTSRARSSPGESCSSIPVTPSVNRTWASRPCGGETGTRTRNPIRSPGPRGVERRRRIPTPAPRSSRTGRRSSAPGCESCSSSAASWSMRRRTESGCSSGGTLVPSHGAIGTPAFMRVGTQGSVKGLSPADLRASGTQILLANTYHLMLRPGSKVIRELGGLHRFMAWDRPVLTDSGGYQVLSLKGLVKVAEEGVEIRSHLDGALELLTPERAMEGQADLRSDIAVTLDHAVLLPP